MSLNILSQNTSRSIFYPTMSEHTNKRTVHCARCKTPLPAGRGHKWDYSDEVYAVAVKLSPSFYCDSCHNHHLALLELRPEVEAALEDIREWCQYVPLSMHQIAYEHISRIVRKCDLAQADVAREIARALGELDEWSYSAAVSTATQVAREVVAIYNGGEA